jgi:4-hydroxybenzoate polyprenyltransferase
LRALTVAHPAPSAINAALVASLATVAGAGAATAGLLATAMFGFQVSIGALNDIVDAGEDRRAMRDKPIPGGLVSVPAARAIVVGGGLVGLAISTGFSPWVLVLGVIGYGAGVTYDLFMRRHGLGWLCFAVAFPALLAWTWTAAAGTLPAAWPFLLPLAALAGPMIHLANSLVDLEADEGTGASSLATRMGPTRSRWTLAGLTATVYLLGWAMVYSLRAENPWAILAAVLATVVAAVGVGLSWQSSRRALQAGWMAQAVGLAGFAVAWIASVG